MLISKSSLTTQFLSMAFTSPPIPTLPPASDLREFSSSPPDFLGSIRRYHADEKAQSFVMYVLGDYLHSKSSNCVVKGTHCKLFPFSVDAFNCMANLYATMDAILATKMTAFLPELV